MSDRDKTAGKRRGAGSSSALNEPKNKVAKTNQASGSGKFVILQTNVKIGHDSPYLPKFAHKYLINFYYTGSRLQRTLIRGQDVIWHKRYPTPHPWIE